MYRRARKIETQSFYVKGGPQAERPKVMSRDEFLAATEQFVKAFARLRSASPFDLVCLVLGHTLQDECGRGVAIGATINGEVDAETIQNIKGAIEKNYQTLLEKQ